MFSDAADHFRKAVRIEPAELQFQLGLANSMAMQQQYGEARRLLERIVARQPRHVMAWFNLANVLRDLNNPSEAIAAYRKTLELEPRFVEARNGVGNVLHRSARLEEAEREFRQCVRDAPEYLPAHQNLASVLIDQGKFDDAESVCRDVVRMDPSNAHAHGMLADTFNARGRMREAAHHYGDAARIAPDDIAIALSYATKLCDIGDVAGGLDMFRHLLQQAPDLNELKQTLATTFLAHGFLAEGWSHYRRRPAFLAFEEKLAHVALAQTLPENLSGMHICVLREQGLGDEIFFLRYARELVQRGARVTYRSSRAIAGMLGRLPEISQIIDAEAAPPPCDADIMAGDLPYALMPLSGVADATASSGEPDALRAFPWTECPYSPLPQPTIRLTPPPAQLDAMRGRLAQIGPPPYLGITWRGGTPPNEQGVGSWLLFKTLAIPKLGAALRGFRGTFIALQRNPEAGEIAAMGQALGAHMHDFTLLNKDLEAMLALLALIDDYVGVSNTNMHLRAAAGRAARVLVPAPAEWRWMATGTRSPWFPGFAVYRQSTAGDWDVALAQLAADITA